MKIRVPIQCQDVDLNDKEKVVAFLVMMTTIQLKANDWPSYKLTFYRKDISHILGSTAIVKFKALRQLFRITVPNEYTVSFEWKTAFKQGGRAIIFPPSILQDIQDEEAILAYYYLLGRFSGNEPVFREGPYQGVYTNTARSVNNLTSFLYNQVGLKDEE